MRHDTLSPGSGNSVTVGSPEPIASHHGHTAGEHVAYVQVSKQAQQDTVSRMWVAGYWVLNSVVLCSQGSEVTAWSPLAGLPPHTRATHSCCRRAPLHPMPCPYSDTNTPPSKPPLGLGAASTPALRIQCWLEARLLPPSRSVTLHKFHPHGLPSLTISTVGSFWHLLLGTPSGDLPIEMPCTCYHMRHMPTLSHGKVRKR